MPRLIWVFTGRTCHFVGFIMRRFILWRPWFLCSYPFWWIWQNVEFDCVGSWPVFLLLWFIYSAITMLAFASSKIIETLKTGTYLAISLLLILSVFSFEPYHDKTCFCQMRTTKAQISLRIRAVWSAPLLFGAWIVCNGWLDELGFYVPSTVFQSFRDEDSI